MGSFGSLIGLAIFAIFGWWAWQHFFNRDDYSKPWWDGTSTQQVCPTRYDGQRCYNVSVVSDGQQVTDIYVPSRGYLYGSSECYEAAEGLYQFDRFCRFWGQNGEVYDINPILASYPEYRQ